MFELVLFNVYLLLPVSTKMLAQEGRDPPASLVSVPSEASTEPDVGQALNAQPQGKWNSLQGFAPRLGEV